MARLSYSIPIVFAGLLAGFAQAGDAPPVTQAETAKAVSTDSTSKEPEDSTHAAAGTLSKFQEVCAACHGAKGEGNVELKTPSIAGLPGWYVLLQIEKFKKDYRGNNPEDLTGVQMHGIAKNIDEEAAKEVAETIQNLKLIPMKNTLGGDEERGAEIFRETCMECHRYNGRGEVVFRSAPLIGLQDWYIVSQMKKFQSGIRGGVEEDLDGAKMHRITETLSETDFKDVAAHLAELAEKYGTGTGRRRRYR